MTYIVYSYYFPDGKVYIGRTHKGSDRLGNWESYKNQYVYKKMLKYDKNIKIAILFETENIFLAFELEHKLIQKFFKNSYNANLEENWFDNALKYLAQYVHPTQKETYDMLSKWNEIVLAIFDSQYDMGVIILKLPRKKK